MYKILAKSKQLVHKLHEKWFYSKEKYKLNKAVKDE